MKEHRKWVKALALMFTVILCLPIQTFALDLSLMPNNTIKLGDDFFSMNSSAMQDAATIPIASLLADGPNKNKGYFKFGDLWYDAFSLDATQFLNPDYAMTSEQVAAISQGNKWYKTGDEVITLTSGIVDSLATIADINVYTGKDAIVLPKVVATTLGDLTTVEIPVTWDSGTPTYDKYTAGEYEFTGTLTLPEGITNPFEKKAKAKVIVNAQNTAGTTLYEMESLAELQQSASATVSLDAGNSLYGTASINLIPLAPISVDADSSYYSVVANGLPGISPSAMENMEFSFYAPDPTQIDYLLVKFYTDDWHNVFYENGIGGWELNIGWNKIRRTISDFTYVNSTGTTSASRAASLDSSQSLPPEWQKMNESIKLLNNIISKQKESSLERSDVLKSTEALASSEEITAMEIYVVYNPGKSPSVNIDRIGYNIKGTPKILFTFDDAWLDVSTYGKPILDTKGFKATTWANEEASTIYWNEDTLRNFWFMNETELSSIYADGWDIGNHTYSHPDTIQDEETMIFEYQENQKWILGEGRTDDLAWPRGAYHVCYPSGQYSDELTGVLESIGAKTARTTVHGIQPTPAPDLYKLKCVNVSRDTSIPFVKGEIDRAIATGSSLFFMFHRVEPIPEPDTVIADDGDKYGALAVSEALLTELVNYIDSYVQLNKVDVVTISQWYDTYVGMNP